MRCAELLGVGETFYERKPGCGPVCFGDRDCRTQFSDRRRGDRAKLRVQFGDAPPVRQLETRGSRLARGNLGLQSVGARFASPALGRSSGPQFACLCEGTISEPDERAIPAGALLVGEQHRPPLGVDARGKPRGGERHERDKAERFGPARHQSSDHPGQPQRQRELRLSREHRVARDEHEAQHIVFDCVGVPGQLGGVGPPSITRCSSASSGILLSKFSRLRHPSIARRFAVVVSHAAGLVGTPERGHSLMAAASASCARSSARPKSPTYPVSVATILAASMRQVASTTLAIEATLAAASRAGIK